MRNNFEVLALIFGILSGIILLSLQIRKRLTLFWLSSREDLLGNLSATDKLIAFMALIFFILCMVFLVLSF
jgi:hypothetical protein